MKKISIADIANELKLSKSTVSFVLNGKGEQYNISKKTQALIHEKAKELNYVPNYFAKGLREGRTKTIGLVIPDISNLFYAELTKHIQNALHVEGYSLLVVSSNDDEAMELNLIQNILRRSIDGLIIAPCNKLERIQGVLSGYATPVVWADRFDKKFDSFVGIDNYHEAFSLIRCFSVPPKVIGIVKPDLSDVSTIQLRVDGVIAACNKEQIDFEVIDFELTKKDAQVRLKALIEERRVDSFVALNNIAALNLFQLLFGLKIKLPEQVRLISFDDIAAFTYFSPPITALNQPIEKIARKSAENILNAIEKKEKPTKHEFFACSFVKRGSH